MFSLSLSSCPLIQGPAVRTWNCVAHFANQLWCKLYHVNHPIMPRSRRKHRSRSRSRSKSHSYDRDREPKRRKIESYDSSHKRSLSPTSSEDLQESTIIETTLPSVTDSTSYQAPDVLQSECKKISNTVDENITDNDKSGDELMQQAKPFQEERDNLDKKQNDETVKYNNSSLNSSQTTDVVLQSECKETSNNVDENITDNDELMQQAKTFQEEGENLDKKQNYESVKCNNSSTNSSQLNAFESSDTLSRKAVISKESLSQLTPKKTLSPKQIQKKLLSEKKREEKIFEREKKKQEVLEQKQKLKEENEKLRKEKEEQKIKDKQEKVEQKQKEDEEKETKRKEKEEQKKKEKEEKEIKRKEKEEKEIKRKEKEEQKRKEIEEKNKEKLKQEEKKQKAAAAFANFFKKVGVTSADEKRSEETATFMPFEVKSDMKLACLHRREELTMEEKDHLDKQIKKQTDENYLLILKSGKEIRKSGRTWPSVDADTTDEVIIVEEINLGETIEEQSKNNEKMRAKFLKFADNRRPAYFGTWRKKSKHIKARKPLGTDTEFFDYEYDSDEDWEEGEDAGESLRGSDDEDKENESDNEYEVDNDFFVPHGHLSDDEMNDEENKGLSPEAHKAKLKLLKKEFQEEISTKTKKIKPRVIGCIWFDKEGNNVDPVIGDFLKPLSIISNGQVKIKKRSFITIQASAKKNPQLEKALNTELIPDFLKLIHCSTKNNKRVVTDFLEYLNSKNICIEVTRTALSRMIKQVAEWKRCTENGPMYKKFCWVVQDDVKKKYNLDFST